jgi:hypothetical protein
MVSAVLLTFAFPYELEAESISSAEIASGERAVQQDIDTIVGDQPIDRAEVGRRLDAEFHASIQLDRLREDFGSRWAGAFVEHVNGNTVLVVRLKGHSPETTAAASARKQSSSSYSIRIVEGVEFTEAEIQENIRPKLDAVKNAFPSFQGHYIDDATSEVVILVSRPELFQRDYGFSERANAEREMSVVLSAILSHPARVRALPGPMRNNVSGSGDYLVPGGVCTGGFSVRRVSDGLTGVSTAGHCPNNPITYVNLDGTCPSCRNGMTHLVTSSGFNLVSPCNQGFSSVWRQILKGGMLLAFATDSARLRTRRVVIGAQ